MITRCCGVGVAIYLAACSALAWGADGAIPESGSQADFSQWLEQLDGPEFAERQEASRKLSEAGRDVFPELEKAAESGTREVATRAIDILKKHFERGDFDTKESAQAALQRLAKSSNASAAQRAQSALNPTPAAQPIAGLPFGGQQIRIVNNGQIQLQVGGNAGGGVVKRVHVRNANGKQDIEVEEGNLKVKIQNFPGGNIEIDVTDKIGGKDVTKKVEAKDLDDLKKKDPAAAKIYEQYNQGGGGNIRIGGIQIQGNVVPAQGNALPAVPRAAPDDPFAPRPVPAPAPQPNAGPTRERMIKALDDHLARLKGQAQNQPNPAFDRMIESLELHKKRLQDDANK